MQREGESSQSNSAYNLLNGRTGARHFQCASRMTNHLRLLTYNCLSGLAPPNGLLMDSSPANLISG